MHAMVGEPGDGKGIAYDVSWHVFTWAPDVDEEVVGSGEGLVDVYIRREKDPLDKKLWIDTPYRTRAVLYVAGIDTLQALTIRSGSTLKAKLRKLYSGEKLGFGYRTPEKAAKAAAHSYRASVIIGVQPENADILLNDAKGGTPQRVCWWSTDDTMPKIRPARPDQRKWDVPDLGGLGLHRASGRRILPVCPQTWHDIDNAYVRRHGGERDDTLDGHAMLTRLKLAAGLGLLAGHAEVNDEDWQLSAIPMAWSAATKNQAHTALAAAAAHRNRLRGQADGQRAVAAEQTVRKAGVQRVAPKVLAALQKPNAEWITRNALRSGLKSTDRIYFDGAIDHLTRAGLVAQRFVAGTGQPGTEYKIAQS